MQPLTTFLVISSGIHLQIPYILCIWLHADKSNLDIICDLLCRLCIQIQGNPQTKKHEEHIEETVSILYSPNQLYSVIKRSLLVRVQIWKNFPLVTAYNSLVWSLLSHLVTMQIDCTKDLNFSRLPIFLTFGRDFPHWLWACPPQGKFN